MEGAFAFFLESAFVGIFLFGERRFGQRIHWFSSLMVFLGTWASGYFIITTNSWMQNPVGYGVPENGNIQLGTSGARSANSTGGSAGCRRRWRLSRGCRIRSPI